MTEEEKRNEKIEKNDVLKEEAEAHKKEKPKKSNAELEKMKKLLEEQEAKYSELNDKYLRMMAEYENFRKRAAKEKEGIYADAYSDAVTEILPVMDNLERAVAFSEGEKLTEGVQMTLKQFKDSFEKMGITEIEAQNVPFDPNLHNAVMHIEDESLGENTVVEVFSKGYKKGDKVIRYAMVKVAN